MKHSEIIRTTLLKLAHIRKNPPDVQAFVGFDGYIDRIQKLVKRRINSGVDYFSDMSGFAEKVHQAAGKSAQIEVITSKTKLGGNAPIMANALAGIGIKNHCAGTFGEQGIDPLFMGVHSHCNLIPLGAPAVTHALEFGDGKLMLSELDSFQKLDWPYLKKKIPPEKLSQMLAGCGLIGLVDWSNLPHSSDIWQGICAEVLPHLPPADRLYFFDLTDLSKKPDIEIMEVLEIIGDYTKFGEVVLSLNEKETHQLFQALCRIHGGPENHSGRLGDEGAFIFEKTQLHGLLIHPVDRCLFFTEDLQIELAGKVVSNPVISTGGGDNLNAGFCLGKLSAFSPEECVVLGMATSAAYVSSGKSPDLSGLESFLNGWLEDYPG